MKLGATRSQDQEWSSGWTLIVAAASGMFVTAMPVYSAGVFILPLESAYGWTRSEISSGLFIMSIAMVIGTPLIGILVDRYGPRRVALPGTFLSLACFAGLGLAGPELWKWQAAWLALSIVSLGARVNVYAAAVASRFDRNRGLALSISLVGTAVAMSIMPPLASLVMERQGLLGGYAVLAGAGAVVSLPLLWFFFYGASDLSGTLEQDNQIAQIAPSLKQAERAMLSWPFTVLGLTSFLASAGMTALAVHFVPILVSRGFSAETAALFAGGVGVGSLVGRILAGYLIDRYSAGLVSGCVFILPVIACLLLSTLDGHFAVAVAVAVVFGLAVGGEVDIIAYMTARLFGVRQFGLMFGVVAGLMALGSGLGPLVAGAIYDAQRSYDIFFVIAAIVLAMTALSMTLLGGRKLPPRAEPVGQIATSPSSARTQGAEPHRT